MVINMVPISNGVWNRNPEIKKISKIESSAKRCGDPRTEPDKIVSHV